jgi:hypothetical protein
VTADEGRSQRQEDKTQSKYDSGFTGDLAGTSLGSRTTHQAIRVFGAVVKSAVLSSKDWVTAGLLNADTATGGRMAKLALVQDTAMLGWGPC